MAPLPPAPALRPLLPSVATVLRVLLTAVLLVPALLLAGCATVIVGWSASFPLAEWQVPALLVAAAVLALPAVALRRAGCSGPCRASRGDHPRGPRPRERRRGGTRGSGCRP